jgi:hypothetical protein
VKIEKELFIVDWFVLDWMVLQGKILFSNLSILSLMLCFHIIHRDRKIICVICDELLRNKLTKQETD